MKNAVRVVAALRGLVEVLPVLAKTETVLVAREGTCVEMSFLLGNNGWRK